VTTTRHPAGRSRLVAVTNELRLFFDPSCRFTALNGAKRSASRPTSNHRPRTNSSRRYFRSFADVLTGPPIPGYSKPRGNVHTIHSTTGRTAFIYRFRNNGSEHHGPWTPVRIERGVYTARGRYGRKRERRGDGGVAWRAEGVGKKAKSTKLARARVRIYNGAKPWPRTCRGERRRARLSENNVKDLVGGGSDRSRARAYGTFGRTGYTFTSSSSSARTSVRYAATSWRVKYDFFVGILFSFRRVGDGTTTGPGLTGGRPGRFSRN